MLTLHDTLIYYKRKDIQEAIRSGEIKPYSVDIDKLIYKYGKRKIKSIEEFKKRSSESQYKSCLNRISSLKKYVQIGNMSNYQLLRLKDKLLILIKVIDKKVENNEKKG